MRRSLRTLVAASAAFLVVGAARRADAQKALIYCPAGTTPQCNGIKSMITVGGSPYAAANVDQTADVGAVTLSSYEVVIVVSAATSGSATPYANLTANAAALGTALNGRVAVWSGTPDIGNAGSEPARRQIVRGLVAWARQRYVASTNTGLVVLQDASATNAYAWLSAASVTLASAGLNFQYGSLDPASVAAGSAAAEILGSPLPGNFNGIAIDGLADNAAALGGVLAVRGIRTNGNPGGLVLYTLDRFQKANQATLTLTAPASATFGQTAALSTTGGSGTGAVTYGVGTSTACTVSGSTLTITAGSGSCVVTATKAGDATYNVNSATATVVVAPKAVVITPDAGQTKVFGAADPTLTYTNDGGVAPGAFSGSLARAAGENAGSYAITLGTLSAGGNYSLSLPATPATFAITPRPVTLKATSITRVYGASTPDFGLELVAGSTLANGDALAALGTPTFVPTGTTVAGSPHAIEISGLANANYTINYATGAARGTLTVTPATLAVNAVAASKSYGDENPPFSATYSGYVNGEGSGNVTIAGAPACSVTGTTITCAPGSLSTANYTFVTGSTATLTINARAVTVKAKDVTREYGASTPAFEIELASGTLAPGDNLAVLGTPSFAPSGTTVAGSPHAIDVSGLSNANYNVSYATGAARGKLTVTARAITVAADAQTKVYGADDPVPLTYQITAGSLAAGDVLAGALTRAAGEGVGQYAISQGTLSAGTNYAVTYVGANLTITTRPITVTAAAKSKVYGESDPALTYSVTSGSLVGGDAFTGALARAGGDDVAGSPYAIQQGTLALSANYALTYVGASLTITPKAITVTAAAKTKTYGDADPSLTYTPSEALLAGNSFSGTLSRAAGESVTGSPYAIGKGTLSAGGNYSITFVGASLSITARPVTVKAASITRVYGAETPAFGIELAGGSTLGNGDALSALGTPVFTPAGTTVVGSPHPIDVGGLTNENYAIAYAAGAARGTLTVTPRPITVTAAAKTKTYGDADPELTYTASEVLLAGNSFSGALARAAGNDVAGSPYAIGQGMLTAGPNYQISYVGANLTITPRPVTITPTAGQAKVYGEADPLLAYTTSEALLAGNSFSGTLGRAPGEDVSTYAITLGGLSAGTNYALTLAATPVTFAITPKPITVTPNTGQSKVYGAADPVFTYAVSPALKAGDSFTGALSRAAGENVGTYAIAAGTLSAGTNYAMTFASTPVTFAITPKAITVTAEAKSKVYGSADPALSYQITTGALVGSDAFTGALTRVAGENVVAAGYAIEQGTLALSTNYTLSYVGAKLTITPRPVTITPTAGQSKVYGTPDPTFAYTASEALLSGNSFTGALSRVAGENVAASPYAITMGTLSAGANYSLSLPATPVTFAITPAPATVTLGNLVQPANNIQGPTATTTPATLVGNVVFTYVVNGAPTTTRPTAVGVYAVTATINNTNYTAAPDNGYFVIYDPNGGFVTGGGWITSPLGACKLAEACTNASGKANFGFVSKYQNGARTPTGNTEFQFHAGNLNFKSSVYEWLTVAGARAQFKGDGTINGVAGYKFILTAVDGSVNNGGGDGDQFRIKIMRMSDSQIVYDNMVGSDLTLEGDVNAPLTGNGTLLGGGSISIKR